MTFDKLRELFSQKKQPNTIADLREAREKLAALRVRSIAALADLDRCIEALDEKIAQSAVIQELCGESDDDSSEDSGDES